MKSVIICILSFSFTILASCDFSTNNENNEIEGKEGVILYYNQAAKGALMLLDIETEHTKMITDSADGFARWSPDGKRIAYIGPSEWESSNQVYVMNVDGSGLCGNIRENWSSTPQAVADRCGRRMDNVSLSPAA